MANKKSSINLRDSRKRGKEKQRTNETNRNMIDFNLNISTITLNMNGLNIPIKRKQISDWITKTTRLKFKLFTEEPLKCI